MKIMRKPTICKLERITPAFRWTLSSHRFISMHEIIFLSPQAGAKWWDNTRKMARYVPASQPSAGRLPTLPAQELCGAATPRKRTAVCTFKSQRLCKCISMCTYFDMKRFPVVKRCILAHIQVHAMLTLTNKIHS
jgi:hypothetical protein